MAADQISKKVKKVEYSIMKIIVPLFMVESISTHAEYNNWLDTYIQTRGLDITAHICQGVMKEKWYDITAGQILDKSRTTPQWWNVFHHRLEIITENKEVYQFLSEFAKKAIEMGYTL